MEYYKMLTIIGLSLDIIGAALIYYHGLPSKVVESYQLELMQKPSNEKQASNKKIRSWARIGIILIIYGFVSQLIGAFLQA